MITIQSAMLTALGFLVAALIACFILPAYRNRVERLVTMRIRQSMPVTEAEVRADHDRMRAEYAIRMHELATKVEKASLNAARQKIEINRRDAAISGLEIEKLKLANAIEEHENARRVLEHTVTDRLPLVEGRLSEAKRLIVDREQEISRLTHSVERHTLVIEDATRAHIHQQQEIERQQFRIGQLNAALDARGDHGAANGADSPGEREVRAMAAEYDAEIERARASISGQAGTIASLRAELANVSDRLALLSAQAQAQVAGSAHGTSERVGGEAPAQAKAHAGAAADFAPRRPLSERIAEPLQRLSFEADGPACAANDVAAYRIAEDAAVDSERPARPGSHLKALDGGALGVAASAVPQPANDKPWLPSPQGAQANGDASHGRAGEVSGDHGELAEAGLEGDSDERPARRLRLMDRITGLDKSSG